MKTLRKWPADADGRTVEQYTRAYLWFLLTKVASPNCSGDTALWMYLYFLADWDTSLTTQPRGRKQRPSSEPNKCIFESSDALGGAPGIGGSENKLRDTMKKFVKHCRKLMGLLGCVGSSAAHDPAGPQGTIASSSHVASSSRLVEQEYEEEEDEESNEKEYDDDDEAPPTQTTQLEKRKASKKDWQGTSPFQKPRPHQLNKKPDETCSKNNEDRTSKRGRRK
ncbi:Serine/threonine-protein phosphatase 7 long form-like protein [Hordeum vulgare]|nr:Serine/threonine-protein phosphatase 7 long form-like protein [Hordeum vulgare]